MRGSFPTNTATFKSIITIRTDATIRSEILLKFWPQFEPFVIFFQLRYVGIVPGIFIKFGIELGVGGVQNVKEAKIRIRNVITPSDWVQWRLIL